MSSNQNLPATTSAPSGVFVSTLTALQSGQFVNKIDDVLREVTKAVAETGLKGAVTLKLVIAPNGVGAGDMPIFKLTPKIAKTIPEMPQPSQAFFTDQEHNLQRRMPGQGEMRLEVVRGDADAADKAKLANPAPASAAQ